MTYEIYVMLLFAGESICIWFCWCTWGWDQFVFYTRYLKRL